MALTPEIEDHVYRDLYKALLEARGRPGETIEINRVQASWVLDVLAERRRGRGAPSKRDDIGPAVVVKIAKVLKRDLQTSGVAPGEAKDRAAELASRIAGDNGINLAPSTIGRRMDKADA
jgi:hypothetical protein